MHSVSPLPGPCSSTNTPGAPCVQAQHEDDATIEDLLYDAQMEMIAHRHDRAIHKLEQAVERGSSAACATLANLFSRGYCRAEQVNPTVSMSPPATGSAPSSVSPPVARPRLPNRSTSWNCHHEHQGHRSAESLKAAELYLKGLEIELDKPVEPPGRRGRKVTDESSSEEERAEGRYWTLQHALDLIVGLTDAHRFGVLQPPSTSESSNLNGSQPGKDPLDTSWNRSSRVSTRMLSHSTIAPVLATLSAESPISTLPIDPHSPTAAAPAPALARAMSTSSSSRRSQSVSRSYTHPAASIPDPGVHHQNQNRKLQVTIAIHALYILALQAFSSPSPVPVPDLPTPDASPVMSDETPIASSPTSVDSRASTAANLVRPGREAASEHGEKLSSTLFDIILRLAADPSNRVNGSIGIREGDELVSRARRRLDAIRNVERPGGDDWRFAKKKKNQSSVPAPIVDKKAGVRIPSQERLGPGHVKDRSDGTTSSSMTITPCSLNRRNLKFHFAEEEADDSETTRHAYPSPPDTPPATAEHLAANRQLAPLDTTTVAAGSSSPSLLTPKSLRSPPLASPLQPRYRSLHSQSSTQLARPRRDSLSSFRSTTPSALARFSDPSQRLLRRVESSTSVCTVPPDFGATRLKAGNKGKGKAFVDDPNDLGFGRRYGTGEMASGAARLGATTRGGDEDRKVGKSWLSRFFSVSGLNAVRESPNNDAKERLKEALKRDDEASSSVEYIMDWGDEDAPTEDEEEENICRAQLEDAATSPERRHSPVLEPVQASPPVVRPLLESAVTRPSLPRRQSSKTSLHSKRSFVLNDPTTSSSSDTHLSPTSPHHLASNSPRSSRRNRHRRHPSSSSSSNFLSPLSAANPASSRSSRSRPDKAAVPIDPLLLELERRSRVGVRTVCQNCHKKGLNYPACRTCGKCYCSRTCRVGEGHECVQ